MADESCKEGMARRAERDGEGASEIARSRTATRHQIRTQREGPVDPAPLLPSACLTCVLRVHEYGSINACTPLRLHVCEPHVRAERVLPEELTLVAPPSGRSQLQLHQQLRTRLIALAQHARHVVRGEPSRGSCGDRRESRASSGGHATNTAQLGSEVDELADGEIGHSAATLGGCTARRRLQTLLQRSGRGHRSRRRRRWWR